MEKVEVIILPEGKQAREINKMPKPTVGFYDFNDPYDEESFERAKHKWQEAEKKCRTFDVVKVQGKPYPHVALGTKFWHLLPNKEYTAEILSNGKTINLIK